MLSALGTEYLLCCPQEEAAETLPLLHLVLGLVLVFKAGSQWSHMLPLRLKLQTANSAGLQLVGTHLQSALILACAALQPDLARRRWACPAVSCTRWCGTSLYCLTDHHVLCWPAGGGCRRWAPKQVVIRPGRHALCSSK